VDFSGEKNDNFCLSSTPREVGGGGGRKEGKGFFPVVKCTKMKKDASLAFQQVLSTRDTNKGVKNFFFFFFFFF